MLLQKGYRKFCSMVLCLMFVCSIISPAYADGISPRFSKIHAVDCSAQRVGNNIEVSACVESIKKEDLKIVLRVTESDGTFVDSFTYKKSSAYIMPIDEEIPCEDGVTYICKLTFYAGDESTSKSIIVK